MDKVPIGVNVNDLIDHLRILSWEASDILIYYSKLLKKKENNINILKNANNEDPVTLADLKVNEMIIQEINKKYKNVNWEILSEENVKMDSKRIDNNSDFLWILDPLDGTKDFIQGTGNYAMHLALSYKNQPYAGVVLIPERNEIWITNGNEVWCERRDGAKKKFKISNFKSLRDMTLVTSKNHRNELLTELSQKINFKNSIYMGSIGCKIASILRGESDIYISLSLPGKSAPKDWDFAAPEAILKAAGGAITNLYNESLVYNQKGFEQRGVIIASNNGNMHGDICLEVKKVIEKYKIFQSLI